MFLDKDDGIEFIDPPVCLKGINLCEIFMMDDRYVLKLFVHYGIIKNGGLRCPQCDKAMSLVKQGLRDNII